MKQHYFILVVAHSLHGRLRRIHVPHSAIYAVLVLALLGSFSVFGVVSSYLRMVWKVANYNTLRAEVTALRSKYATLERSNNQANQQLANLQLFASEVSLAYGLKRQLEGPPDIINEGRLVPTLHETLDQYDFLKTARIARPHRNTSLQLNARPILWPVEGRLMSYFGERNDPFLGSGVFHTGVDIQAPIGTAIRATADGTVAKVGVMSGYGKLVILEHPGGVQTYYGHLSAYNVLVGQEVRIGNVIGFTGITGRTTGAHLHYEVRIHGNPINPSKYLQSSAFAATKGSRRDFPF